jgi:hypothetical protein
VTPEETTVQVLILWALALSTIINLGTVIWNIFSGPSKKNGARLDAMSVTLGALELRIGSVETKQASLPSKDDMHELELTMSKLSGDIATMNEKLSGHVQIMTRLEATVSRHEDHLLKKS